MEENNMKKLLSAIIVSVLMFMNVCGALAEAPVLPAPAEASCSEGGVYVALVEGCQELAGLLSPCEHVERLPVQTNCRGYVRGFGDTKGSVIRMKSVVRVMEEYIGLTYLTNIKVVINPTVQSIVNEIIVRRLGEDASITSPANIISCTFWRPCENYIAHIFFTPRVEHFEVGQVIFNNGMDTAILYAGDFDGDGTLELGFEAGWSVPRPAPVPSCPSVPKKPCTPCNKKCGGFNINIELKIGICVKVTMNCVR